MASEFSVEAVKNAIVSVYASRAEPTRARKGDLIAASGVSQKTFYRVLEDHPDVVTLLRAVEAVFVGKPPDRPTAPSDPVQRDPKRVAKELLGVIASLVGVVEEQKVRIRDLELSLAVATDPDKAGHPAPASLSEARGRHRRNSRQGK